VILPLLAILLASAGVDAAPATVLPNDNTHAAGRLDGHRLTLALVAANGTFRPEGPHAPAHDIAAFGEEWQPPSAPGPLVRVKAGTEISITVRNRLAYELTVHGLCNRPGTCPDQPVAPGGASSVRFTATTPGLYGYWAAAGTTPLDERSTADSELNGVIAVDPVEGAPPDRIFVVAILADAIDLNDLTFIPTMNGASWPYTERLHAGVGDDLRFRVVNLSFESHAMHLHGFHFQVYAHGDLTRDRQIPLSRRSLAVTERISPGETFSMRWMPTRPGNWLFHCHMVAHMTPDPAAPANHDPHDMRMSGGMAGLVVGVIVTGTAPPAPAASAGVDRATMAITREDNASGKHPTYRVDFPERNAPRIAEGSIPGPVLVVQRGRPTAISIENHTPDPTAIHWHGIEIDSYFDGVPGFGGNGASVTPPIAPGGTFVATFTPPRAGTYIYHTHWHDLDQLSGGLYGPLVVLPPGQTFDPATDHVVMIGVTNIDGEEEPLVLNGKRKPAPIVFRAGVANRLRLINISGNNVALVVRLTERGETAAWTPRGRDGAALPGAMQVSGVARTPLTVGGTFDAEIAASRPRQLWLEVRRGTGQWELQAPVDVK